MATLHILSAQTQSNQSTMENVERLNRTLNQEGKQAISLHFCSCVQEQPEDITSFIHIKHHVNTAEYLIAQSVLHCLSLIHNHFLLYMWRFLHLQERSLQLPEYISPLKRNGKEAATGELWDWTQHSVCKSKTKPFQKLHDTDNMCQPQITNFSMWEGCVNPHTGDQVIFLHIESGMYIFKTFMQLPFPQVTEIKLTSNIRSVQHNIPVRVTELKQPIEEKLKNKVQQRLLSFKTPMK